MSPASAWCTRWMPFNVAQKFISGDGASRAVAEGGPPLSTATLSPGWALTYFAAFAAVLLLVALGVAKRRDA